MSRPQPMAGDSALGLVEAFSGRRVWVVGDLMLDDYLEGAVERVSPEAPVQVVKVKRSYQRLGGAGNVANAVVALGGRVQLLGILGSDREGDRFLDVCREVGIDSEAVGRRDDRPTIRKQRVLARQQQILRLDWEEARPIPAPDVIALFDLLCRGELPDVVILSDYDKGLLTPETLQQLIAWCRQRQVPVIIDPKVRDVGRYAGASLLTPNLKELELATGRRLAEAEPSRLAAAAKEYSAMSDAEALCVTLGARGMLLLTSRGEVEQISASAREVYDVTGAGDTVVATLALALAAQAPLATAARLANRAAGLVVGKAGTAEVTAAELLAHLDPAPPGKLLDRKHLAATCRRWRQQGRRIVFTNGCFDLLHAGHLKLLREAAQHGDLLLVGLNSDASVKDLKGAQRPLVPEHERAALLAALEIVDGVVIFGEATPGALIDEIIPHILVKGADYRIDQVVGRETVEAHGGRVVLVDLLRDHSTTALAQRMGQAADGRSEPSDSADEET